MKPLTTAALGAAVCAGLLAAAGPALADPPMNYLEGDGIKTYPTVALTWGVLVISIVVMILIGVLVLWGVLARRAGGGLAALAGAPLDASQRGLSWIVIGTAGTFVVLLATVVWTVVVLADVARPPKPGLTIAVTGNQWWWQVTYLNPDPLEVFDTANEIHIPTGVPVKVVLRSNDVIHSFWAPALTGKMQTIPGMTNITWMEAERPGRYRGQCDQFCGLQHAHMALYVVAEPPAQFKAWRLAQIHAAAPPATPEEQAGARLVVEKCGACHTIRGAEALGKAAPDLTHLMSRQTIAAGALPNTVAGLSGWIANPQAVKPGTKMPTLYLSSAELSSVRSYLLTLK